MLVKFLKIFFLFLAIMLFAFLVNITFYFSNYSKNLDFVSSIALKDDNNIYQLNSSGTLDKVADFSGATMFGVFVQNINKIDKIYFSSTDSYQVSYLSGTYNIKLGSGLYLLDLNDLSSNYKIKGLGFEIVPKSAGMIFVDTTNPKKTLVFSINSIFKFIFKSESGRKVNYYYMYPHNYLIFNVKNNKVSRIGGDVFRIKTIVRDGFFREKLKNNLDLNGLLSGEKLDFLRNVYDLIKSEYTHYNLKFKKLKVLESFSLIGQKYIDNYFDYFINETKKRVYYKQSILNSIQELYNKTVTSTQISQDIINKLKKLKEYNLKDYNDVLSILNGYYKVILKNNSLEDKVILDNFLPLIKYIKLVDSGEIKDLVDLVAKIKSNQNKIFSSKNLNEIYSLSKRNLEYLYLLRNLDKKSFSKVILSLEGKYKHINNKKLFSNKKILLDKYYYGVLNLKQGNDDLELYVLLKNIFFSYDFGKSTFALEKYFNDFVNTYFSKLKIVDGEIIIGQHIDIVLLKSFLYYLEDYLNKFAFNVNVKDFGNERNSKNLAYNINILEKYLFLNKYIYFNSNSLDLLQTGIFKNKYLINNILNFIRKKLFKEERENGLLITSGNYNLSKQVEEKFSSILKEFFRLEQINVDKIKDNPRFKVVLEDYKKLYKKYEEYFSALLNYEEYKTKYSILNKQLDNYKIEVEEKTLGKKDIIEFLSQFNGADLSNTKILKLGKTNEFVVKNFEVNGGIISFKINPERGYLISNLVMENFPQDRKRFYNMMYSLEREKNLWEKNKKYADETEKEKYDFSNYFRNKFFNSYNDYVPIDYNQGDLRKGKQVDTENMRVFKRDKLLAKNGEFSSINDILKLNYNDVIVEDLKAIIINNATVTINQNGETYIIRFNSKYYIDQNANKHYFYDDGGIKVGIYTSIGKEEKLLLGGNKVIIDFNVDLKDFRKIFNDLIKALPSLNKLIYYINNELQAEEIDKIVYKKGGNFVVTIKKAGKKFEFYIKNSKLLFIKENGKILKYKNIDIFKELSNIDL